MLAIGALADLILVGGPFGFSPLARVADSVSARAAAASAGPHFIGLKIGFVLLAILLLIRVRRTVLVRVRGLGWRRMAVVCGIAAALFYAAWIFYLSDTMPSVAVAYNWNTAWLALDTFEGIAALLTAVLLARNSRYAVLSAAAFSTSLCIDALFDVTTAGQGTPLVTAVLEALLVEFPFAALSAVLAVKLLASAGTEVRAEGTGNSGEK